MIKLESKTMVVKAIKKRSQAELFENLRVGDKLYFSVPIISVGRNRRGSYAVYITTTDEKGNTTKHSFNQLSNILKAFELEEL